ncbi:hypothetical protein PGIGA_G00175410 [Pangasianodon gigas]|uniref:Uncharacterized protein n=1 Tax=Pangasianodon gigas TaxID=30993 RepID=A0ACC5XUV2_PANGG|nr:hypothetical protein [Pangasianodon gigas]
MPLESNSNEPLPRDKDSVWTFSFPRLLNGTLGSPLWENVEENPVESVFHSPSMRQHVFTLNIAQIL